MAILQEDAASVLETFVQDVANLPAEIAHLLEEIQAKDTVQQGCRTNISFRDNSIQKHLKQNGISQVNPKEEQHVQAILSEFDKAKAIQDEKCALADKSAILLDRQIKRLDHRIRDLQNDGVIAIDPQLPSLLNNTVGNRVSSLSGSTTGTSTPLGPSHGNTAGPSTTIANSTLSRLVHPQPGSASLAGRHPSPNPLSSSALAQLSSSSSIQNGRGARESSVDQNKRRRLNAHLSVPTPPSGLRQSSLGPGTPNSKAGTPTGSHLNPSTTSSNIRGSSAGPGRSGNVSSTSTGNSTKKGALNKSGNKIAPHNRIGHLNPAAALNNAAGNKKGGSSARHAARRQGKKGSSLANTASDTGEDSAISEAESERSGSQRGRTSRRAAQSQSLQTQQDGNGNGNGAGGGSGSGGGNGDTEMTDLHDPHLRQNNNNNNMTDEAMDGLLNLPEEDEDEGGDDSKYCTCQSVSYGNMVACDNDGCPYEWFHWSCVGITREPVGKWFCEDCSRTLGM